MKNNERFKPDTVPGIYNLPNEDYHDSHGISASGLKLFMQSPAHYYDRYLAEDREPQTKTPALELGSQIHKAILEPGKYFSEYYPLPEKYDRRTKEGKANFEYHEELAKKENKSLISAESHEICQRIAEAIHQSDAAAFLFDQEGLIEQSIFWVENVFNNETGDIAPVLCKCKPDKIIAAGKYILDLKSAGDASPLEFAKSAYNFGYHISAAFYMRGVAALYGKAPEAYILAAFEKERPYARGFYQPDAAALAYGNQYIDRALEDFAECQQSGEWPGYPDQIVPLSLPGWVKAGV